MFGHALQGIRYWIMKWRARGQRRAGLRSARAGLNASSDSMLAAARDSVTGDPYAAGAQGGHGTPRGSAQGEGQGMPQRGSVQGEGIHVPSRLAQATGSMTSEKQGLQGEGTASQLELHLLGPEIIQEEGGEMEGTQPPQAGQGMQFEASFAPPGTLGVQDSWVESSGSVGV